MVSAILVWASLALLAAAIAVFVGAVITSSRGAEERQAQLVLTERPQARSVTLADASSSRAVHAPLPHRAPISSAYGRVAAATHQYALEESSYVDLKAEIVEAFTRLELELDSSVGYRSMSNFEREPRMEVRLG